MDNRIKIFVIEDDPMFGEMMKFMLEKDTQYVVSLFQNGEDFFNHIHLRPEIVTIDYNLPGISGVEILGRIRDYDDTIAAIIVSGQEKKEVSEEAFENGAKAFILKNDDIFTELLQCVKDLTTTSI